MRFSGYRTLTLVVLDENNLVVFHALVTVMLEKCHHINLKIQILEILLPYRNMITNLNKVHVHITDISGAVWIGYRR